MYSVAPLVLRKALADVRVGQVTIPAGTAILIHVFAMHNTSANYERHAEFLPVGFCRGVPPLHPGQGPWCPKNFTCSMQVGTEADYWRCHNSNLRFLVACTTALLQVTRPAMRAGALAGAQCRVCASHPPGCRGQHGQGGRWHRAR